MSVKKTSRGPDVGGLKKNGTQESTFAFRRCAFEGCVKINLQRTSRSLYLNKALR